MDPTESDLIEKLTRIEALWKGATTPGERDAASAARDRVKARLAEVQARDPAVEYRFSLHDPWSRKLFLALVRKYGLHPYRYPRQRYSTVMVRVPKSFVDETLWPHFRSLNRELKSYLASVTDRVVRQALGTDTAEAGERQEPARLPGVA